MDPYGPKMTQADVKKFVNMRIAFFLDLLSYFMPNSVNSTILNGTCPISNNLVTSIRKKYIKKGK